MAFLTPEEIALGGGNTLGWGDGILPNPVVFSRPANLKTVKTDAGMAVTMRVRALFDAVNPQVVFSNWHNLDDVEPALPIRVKASLADPFNNIYPWRFAGADVDGYGIIPPGTNLASLPAGVTIRAGELWKLRWSVIPAAGGSYPVGADIATGGVGFAGIDQVTLNTAVDYTATQNQPAPSGSDALIYGPTAVCAKPTTASRKSPTVMIVGDSTALGFGDNPGTAMATLGKDGGIIQRALQDAGIGHINFGVGGYTAQKAAANQRARLHKMEFVSSVTDAVVLFGTNDLFSGRTFLQIQADLLTIYGALADRGVRVWALPPTPRTTAANFTNGGLASQQTAFSANFGPEAPGVPSEWKKTVDWIKTVPFPLSGVFDTNQALVTFNEANQTYVWADGKALDGTHYNAAGALAGSALIDTTKFK